MGKKKNVFWDKSIQYLRILQILFDYWLSEEHELFVEVDMTFLHVNGEWQKKNITWFNPNYERLKRKGESPYHELTREELMNPPKIEIPFLDDLKSGRIRKVKKEND